MRQGTAPSTIGVRDAAPPALLLEGPEGAPAPSGSGGLKARWSRLTRELRQSFRSDDDPLRQHEGAEAGLPAAWHETPPGPVPPASDPPPERPVPYRSVRPRTGHGPGGAGPHPDVPAGTGPGGEAGEQTLTWMQAVPPDLPVVLFPLDRS